MIAKLLALVQGKTLLIAGTAAATAAFGVTVWLWSLNARLDAIQTRLDAANRQMAQKELALQDVELDNTRLTEALTRQTQAVQALAKAANAVRATADAQAQVIADRKTPPAGDGAAAMQEWWDQNVLQ